MHGIIFKYLWDLKANGLLKDYAEEHFLNKMLRSELDFFQKHYYLNDKALLPPEPINLSNTFLMNFSKNLEYLTKKFSENDINDFIRHQLAAGKQNYSEEQFFRAVAEVNVLIYLVTFVSGFIKGEYEPRLIEEGYSNPEARLFYRDGTIIDVEVKTPGFINNGPLKMPFSAKIKPNVVTTKEGRIRIKDYATKHNLDLVFPRVLKLKDFIESAGKKFDIPSKSNHFNLLFINWTFTDFPECGLCEPISLLANPISGILKNPNVLGLIGLEKSYLEKISAIILYRDTFDSLLTGDFRYHFGHKSFTLLLNNLYNKNSDMDLLCKYLGMNPYGTEIMVNWHPLDWEVWQTMNYLPLLRETADFIYDVLWSCDEIISGLHPDVHTLKSYKDRITLEKNINQFSKYPVRDS